jgi:aryl sulfotransferase
MTGKLPAAGRVYQNHHLDSTRWNYFQPRVGDIVIATSYKSGTTWMQGIVRQLLFLNQPPPPLDDVSPWLDRRGLPIDEVIAKLEQQTHRRFIKTHLALDGLKFFPQVKYIIVGRDPRDVFMSLWNHYSNYTAAQYENLNDTPGRVGPPLPCSPPDIHSFWQGWMRRGWFAWESEGYPFWGNLHHSQAWWEYRHLENILFVHFNDLRSDLKSEIRRIADFLDISVSDESVAKIAGAVSLEAMRREAEQKDPGMATSFQGGAKTFFFKGVNGRWKDVLSAEELELYKRKVTTVLTPAATEWIENGRAALR